MPRQDKKTGYSFWLNLTLIVCAVFFVCLIMGDIFGHSFCRFCWSDNFFSGSYFSGLPFLKDDGNRFAVFFTCYCLSTALAYPIIYCVVRLLLNLKKDVVFDKKNTTYMSVISLLCFLICLICFIGSFACATLILISLIAIFVGLIVQCVRLVMDKAIDMRAELDLTV